MERERQEQVEEMVGALVARLQPSQECVVWR